MRINCCSIEVLHPKLGIDKAKNSHIPCNCIMFKPTNSSSKVTPAVKISPNAKGGLKPAVKVFKAAKPSFTPPAKPHKILTNTVTQADINRVKKITKTQGNTAKSSNAFKKFLGF